MTTDQIRYRTLELEPVLEAAKASEYNATIKINCEGKATKHLSINYTELAKIASVLVEGK